jgi:hypothetical protein
MTALRQAVEWCDGAETFEQREIVRKNWLRLGLEYWFTDYNHEYWRDPANPHAGHCILSVND